MDLNLEPLITTEKIQTRIEELGKELTKKFKDTDKEIVAICVLKGSFIFFTDLVRKLELDLSCEFLAVSSYNGTQSSGEVKMTLDLSQPVEGRHVLLIEDIVDTGLTMNFLKNNLKMRRPESVTTVSLLLKPDALKVPTEVDFVGFEIANDFVVGYGLDYRGLYRNLDYIAQVQNLN